jgi:DNA-binding response OmpR family regulator
MFAKLLFIENEPATIKQFENALVDEKFHLTTLKDPEASIKHLKENHFDIVVVNPKITEDGKIVRRIRQLTNIPLVVITDKMKDVEKAIHLEDGADDVIPLPFSEVEMVARMKSLVRRTLNQPTAFDNEVSIPPYTIKVKLYEVYKGNTLIPLTKGEFNILLLLAMNPNKVFTKEEIYNRVWRDDYVDNPNALNVHIHNLRKKLEVNPKKPKLILTKWGVGFRIGITPKPSV